VRAIADAAGENDHRFSEIVLGIVASDAFQMRVSETAAEQTELVARTGDQ
jgi:hypothetical protein